MSRLNRTLRLVTLASAITLPNAAFSQQLTDSTKESKQVVVTGTLLESDLDNSGSSVSVLTNQDLKDGQYRNALNAIKQVPGVDVVQSGGNGGNAGVFLF